ncbi:MAG: putative ABC transport system ATP-binding protein [Arenicella sp.]|jgi:putative ABC transport system ATP-binding protein
MLTLRSISKTFLTQDVETRALTDVSIDINAGEFAVITGSSGSGKTTLLNVAGLLESADTGVLTINGKDASVLSDVQRSRMRRETIGFIFQSFNLISDLSVADNISLPLRLRSMSKSDIRAKVEESLATVGLSTRHSHYPTQLSGGQQQRVAIARALAGEPKLIFADEPTGNLDSTMSDQVMGLLKGINERGTTIVMVTHDDDQANIGNRRILMRDGRVVDDGRG